MLLRVRSPSGVCKKIDGYNFVSVYFLGDSTGNRLTAIADRESAKADNRVQRVKDWSEATRL